MKSLVNVLFLFIFPVIVLAANVEFTASVNTNQVANGERFQIQFSLNSNGSNFTPPSFPAAFRVLSGPNQSSSTQWVNGNMSSSISFSFVLMAMAEGTHTIPSATIRVGKETLETEPITITVTKGANATPNQQGQQQQPTAKEATDDIFIKVFVDKSKVYQGEPIVATYKLYTRVQLVDNAITKLPDLTGFWSQDVAIKPELRAETVNGVRYDAAILKQSILFPQRTGTLELDPLVFDCVVRFRSNKRSRSVFDQFFGGYEDKKFTIKSKPLKVEVQPLPTGKPKDFTGAVGKFTLASKMNTNRVKANDAINLTLKITGSGNIKLMEAPKFNFPPDFEVYDPKVNDHISVTSSGVSGERAFEYLIIPRHAGNYSLPPVSFSYFDVNKKQYITLSSDTINIVVDKGDESSVTTYSSANKEDIKYIGKDIRYIKTHPVELKEKGKYFFLSVTYLTLMALPASFFFLLLLFRKEYIKQQSDVVNLRRRRSTKLAKKRLALAKKHLKDNKTSAFYEEVFKAMYGYLGDKLNISVSDLSKDTIAQKLSERAVEKEVIDKLFSSIDLCEMARFAPVNDIKEQEVYDEAVNIITKIEKNS